MGMDEGGTTTRSAVLNRADQRLMTLTDICSVTDLDVQIGKSGDDT